MVLLVLQISILVSGIFNALVHHGQKQLTNTVFVEIEKVLL